MKTAVEIGVFAFKVLQDTLLHLLQPSNMATAIISLDLWTLQQVLICKLPPWKHYFKLKVPNRNDIKHTPYLKPFHKLRLCAFGIL